MRWHRLVVPAVVALVLRGGGWLAGQEQEKGERPGKKGPGFFRGGGNMVQFLAKKLDLSDKQQEEVKKIQEEYQPKREKLFKQVQELTQQEMKAFEAVLTDDQRAKLREFMASFKGKRPRKGGDD